MAMGLALERVTMLVATLNRSICTRLDSTTRVVLRGVIESMATYLLRSVAMLTAPECTDTKFGNRVYRVCRQPYCINQRMQTSPV